MSKTHFGAQSRFFGVAMLGAALTLAAGGPAQSAKVNITTNRYDNLRTGWNKAETILTPASVLSTSFNMQAFVPLDEQVDAQPLIVTGQSIAGQGVHDVVYVATENNTVYAIDSTSGAILTQRNLGTPVPMSVLPGQCVNNSQVIGIGSTPVIDLPSQTIFVITDTYENSIPTYRLHALSLADLSDKVSPAPIVSASAKLTNGSIYNFNSAASRQRSALLLSGGNVYAGFSSYCDADGNLSRGWLLGWNARTLLPVTGEQDVRNRLSHTFQDMFLSSIWMSGGGLAADNMGNLYFVTGNSDAHGNAYNYPFNLAESAIAVTRNLATLVTFFTPHEERSLDKTDNDFGAGAILLLPDQSGKSPHVATAAGKTGKMYLLNRDNMGGYNPGGPDSVLDTVDIGPCWCGESYFTGADGVNRIVSSGGNNVITWKLQTSPSAKLVQDQKSSTVAGMQDGGFMTSVSSRGNRDAIIWAIGRPVDSNPANIQLYAFDATNLNELSVKTAGTWPNTGGNANIVPVVANGMIYVASFHQLSIYGLNPSAATTAAPMAEKIPAPAPLPGHIAYGKLANYGGSTLTLTTRTGETIKVDIGQALNRQHSALTGDAFMVRWDRRSGGTLHAISVVRAKSDPAMWGPDR